MPARAVDGGLPEGWSALEPRDGAVVVLGPIEPWLDLQRFRACRVVGPAASTCQVVTDERRLRWAARRRVLSQLGDEYLAEVDLLGRDDAASGPGDRGTVTIEYELPVSIRGPDEERTVEVTNFAAAPGGAWRIVGVRGVGHRFEGGPDRVVLDRTGDMSGTLILALDVAATADQRGLMPELFETRPHEGRVRSWIRDVPALWRWVCANTHYCELTAARPEQGVVDAPE